MNKLILAAAISALVSGVAFADRNAPSVDNTAIKSFNTYTDTTTISKPTTVTASGNGAAANNGGTAQGGNGNIIAGGDVKVANVSGSASNQQYQIADARIPTSQLQSQVATSNNLGVVGKYEVNTVNGAAGGITAAFGGRVNGSPVVSGGSVVATNGGTAIPVSIGSIDVALRNALNTTTTTTTNPVVLPVFPDFNRR